MPIKCPKKLKILPFRMTSFMEWDALATCKITYTSLKALIGGDDLLGVVCWIIRWSSIWSNANDFTMIWGK